MRTLARAERAALSELLEEVGPDAPTLCDGWTTLDLAAHLVVREGRPDSGPGLVFAPLAGYTERVRTVQKRRGYPELIRRVAAGPPRWSLFAIGRVDQAANTVEYFVHHEDVRRGQPDWAPRELPPEDAEQLWRRLRGMARLAFRAAPVGVTLARPDGQRLTVRPGSPAVTISGPPGELVLYVTGRQAHARVTVEGDAQARAALAKLRLGI